MAEKEKTEKVEKAKKQGSGAWIREQLLQPNYGKTDELLAAEARERFGGNTGVSDIAWNRNKLRREGKLPHLERKAMIIVTKLTAKNQTTIPREVRRRLQIGAGDKVAFVVAGDQVVLRALSPTDAAFLKLAGDSFADWSDPEAERAFRGF